MINNRADAWQTDVNLLISLRTDIAVTSSLAKEIFDGCTQLAVCAGSAWIEDLFLGVGKPRLYRFSPHFSNEQTGIQHCSLRHKHVKRHDLGSILPISTKIHGEGIGDASGAQLF